MTAPTGGRAPAPPDDLAALAKGGRLNFYGFLLRLAARIPFLFIAGRMYGAELLGRFAYAILIVEFAAQLSTLGLKRGLAQALATTERSHTDVVWDALAAALIASLIAAALLVAFPTPMFPTSDLVGAEHLLPLIIPAIALTDVALSALAYRGDIATSVRARSLVEPWTISIAAGAMVYLSSRDGLIIAYVLSMVAALAASVWPLYRAYGRPERWRPRVGAMLRLARDNVPLAGADAAEWLSRRLDIALLGLFYQPAVVGIYYVAQQVTTLPQKLKTSFDPVLGPALARQVAANDKVGIAAEVRQVGFWVLAAQTGVALALAIPGEAVLGLVGAKFVGGNGILLVLMAAEVAAATAVVSEAALVYLARKRNLLVSALTLGLQAALTLAAILVLRTTDLPANWQAVGPAVALLISLAAASVIKAWLLSRLLGQPVSGWRGALLPATGAAVVVGFLAAQLPEWASLLLGVPAILAAFGWVIWTYGFTPSDRILFKRSSKVVADPDTPPSVLPSP